MCVLEPCSVLNLFVLCVPEPCSVLKLFLLSLAEHGWLSAPHRGATEVLTQLALCSGGGLSTVEPPPLSLYLTPPNGGSSRRKKKKPYDQVFDYGAVVPGEERSAEDSVSADGEALSASGLVSTMTEDEFLQLSSTISSFTDSRVHCTESLQGKQKNCVLCKYLGRKTNEGLLKVRTRAKCNACDTPLCKGPPRNCFRDFHELYKKYKFPDLKWSHASVYQYPGRGVNARFIISPEVSETQQWPVDYKVLGTQSLSSSIVFRSADCSMARHAPLSLLQLLLYFCQCYFMVSVIIIFVTSYPNLEVCGASLCIACTVYNSDPLEEYYLVCLSCIPRFHSIQRFRGAILIFQSDWRFSAKCYSGVDINTAGNYIPSRYFL